MNTVKLSADNEFELIFKLREYDTELFTLGAEQTHAIFLEDHPECTIFSAEILDCLKKKEAYMNAEFILHSKHCAHFDDSSGVVEPIKETPF